MSRENLTEEQIEELKGLVSTTPSSEASTEKEVYHGASAVSQVEENLGRPLSYAERRVVEEEGYVATPYLDTKGITTQGVGQTGEWIEKGFEAAFQHHVERTQSRIPTLLEYPEELQAELIQAEYRGDLGVSPKFITLLNAGRYNEASLEFLDNKDYRESLESGTGVHKRMEKVSNAVKEYPKSLLDEADGDTEKRRAVPEAASSKTNYQVGNSGYEFVDGDTFRNKETGERYRLPGIDLLETDKVLREKGFIRGESGGEISKQLVASLLNKYGYTTPVLSDKDAGYERFVGDLKDENGNLASDFLIAAGIAKPTFIGNTRKTMSDQQYANYTFNRGDRALMQSAGAEKTDYEIANDLIRAASLADTGGEIKAKVMALNEEQFALMPEVFSDVILRNNNATLENRDKTPFSSSWDAGLTLAANSFKQVGVMGTEILGFDDARVWLQSSIDYDKQKLRDKPKILMDFSSVDWTSLDDISEYLSANLAMSLPFMGVTAASLLAAGPTKGLSLSAPVAMYSGMIIDEMEGNIEDKSFSLAIAGGSIAAALDVFGIKALVKPSAFVTKSGRTAAVNSVKNAQGEPRQRILDILGPELAKNIGTSQFTTAQAELALARMSKRQMAALSSELNTVAKEQLKKGNILRRFTNRLVVGAAFEGSTEVLQEVTQYTAAVLGSDKTWDYDELQDRMINAVAAGGILGAGFSVPVSTWEAGSWKDAVDAAEKYEGKFDDTAEIYKNQERAENEGNLKDLDQVIEEEWESANAEGDPLDLKVRRSAPPGFESDVSAGASADEVAVEEQDMPSRAERGRAKLAERGTKETLADAFKNPQALLISALDNVLTKERLDRSRTLRRVYDMFGGRSKKVHGGVDFQSDKTLNYTGFTNLLPNYDSLLNSFNLDKRRTGQRRKELSTLMSAFYKIHIEPITKRETTFDDGTKRRNNAKWITAEDIIARIDWDNLANEKFQRNSAQIKEFVRALYAVDEKIYEDITARQKLAGVPIIGNLQDHVFRSKNLRKDAIAANKDLFTKLLTQEYGIDPADAAELTDILIDNAEAYTLEDAFDLTKGGAIPQSVKRRTLNLSDNANFDQFLEQNLFDNLDRGMKGAARYMTTLKFLGPNSKLINSMLSKVYFELRGDAEVGSDREVEAKETMELLAANLTDLINADSGNYKRIQSDAIRGAQKFLTLAGVITMLPLAAPMSIVEFALSSFDVNIKTLNKNVGSLGIILGREIFEYFAEIGKVTGINKNRSNFDTRIKSRMEAGDADPRFIDYADPRGGLLRRIGMLDQKTGQAQLVGVSEANEFTQAIMDSFFKMIGLTAVTNSTRGWRAALYNDFLVNNLNILHMNGNNPDTNETKEARRQLEKYGIPVDTMLVLSEQILARGGDINPESTLMKQYTREFENGLYNFVNSAVPLPDAMGRPLFYSNPHLALFTQFQGFISKFTAQHIPRLWDSVRRSTPGFKYSTFATLMAMLLLGYAAQHLKDLIKFGETSPYLTDNEKYLRALYSSGLLGTTERVLSNNLLFPLYKDRSRTLTEGTWNFVTGEAPASNIFENTYGTIRGVLEDDSRKAIKSFASLTPASPFKHRIYDTLVQNEWITGDN